MSTPIAPSLKRRRFIRIVGGSAAGAALAGCGDSAGPRSDTAPTPDAGADGAPSEAGADGPIADGGAPRCDDPFAGGSKIGDVAFLDGGIPFDRKLSSGLDGRLYTDLRELDFGSEAISNRSFYIRTHEPDQIDTARTAQSWKVQISGLVASSQPGEVAVADWMGLELDQGQHLLECSGNGPGGAFGLMSACGMHGVPLKDVFDKLAVDGKATRVVVRGFDGHSQPSANNHSTPGASWNFAIDELIARGAFFATQMNGQTLPRDHGFPLRLFMPRWYGCSCIKWVDGLDFVDDTSPPTGQMIEFATRTHQTGTPPLAKDWRPASQDQSAMPVRVEKWRLPDSSIAYKVLGILWGGDKPTDKLMIRFESGGQFVPVGVCPKQTSNQTWTLWLHMFKPQRTGKHTIRCGINDSSVPQIRLDLGWYDREVNIDEI